MSISGRLQKAVEITVAAGYQIDREAFEFLSVISATDDPADLINRVLYKIEQTENKPLFIEKKMLETLLKKPEIVKEKQSIEKTVITEKPQEQTVEKQELDEE